MSATICGHERDALTYVLNVAASDHNNPTADPLQSWDVLCYRLGPNDVQVDYSTGLLINRGKRTDLDASVIAAKRVGAWFAIYDPAKLAELMASALRERGIGVIVVECGTILDPYPPGIVWRHFDEFAVEIGTMHTGRLFAPAFRAKLLAIMQTTPDESSREACERILRGET